jgi:hypothetical protein
VREVDRPVEYGDAYLRVAQRLGLERRKSGKQTNHFIR